MKSKLIAIAALSGFAAVGAQAFQGEQNPLPPAPFQSAQPRAAIKAEARNPLHISNGGTGVLAARADRNRADVRAEARRFTREEGVEAYGELYVPHP